MTGLPRWAIAIAGVAVVVAALVAVVVIVGAASMCGFDENQAPTGYCAAGGSVRFLVVAIPAVTLSAGYGASLWKARITPVAVAATLAVVEAVVLVGVAY
jgi:hypothetical protein